MDESLPAGAGGSTAHADSPADRSTGDPATVDLDGRTLAYAEYGDPEGTPVFAFHGVLGSRLTWALCDGVARESGIRVVAPERPGFGHSAFQPRRRLLDWPGDVAALADRLGVDRFGVVGFSAGGPHAAACAHAVPDRLRGVALASAVAPPGTYDRADPFNRALLSATRFVPGFSQLAFGVGAWSARYARPQFRRSIVATAGGPDRDLFDEPAGDHLLADAAEAFRQGGRGPARDLPLVGNDWGFDVRDIDRHVSLFHGRADETVTPGLARAFADRLPDCDLRLSEEAHYSTYVRNREAILRAAAGQ
ncbi:MAG: alpha/beta fold hydrolase [Haloarculaceae archaeon]